jgi:hypothetical protein
MAKSLILEVEVQYTQKGFFTYNQRVVVSESVYLDTARLAKSTESMRGLVEASLKDFFRNLKKRGGSINIAVREFDDTDYRTTAMHTRYALYSTCEAIDTVYWKWYGHEQETIDKYNPSWEGDARTCETRALAMTAEYKKNSLAWEIVSHCLDKWLVASQGWRL